MQRQRNRVIPMDARRSLHDLLRASGLRVRQLCGHPGEMPDALMATDQ